MDDEQRAWLRIGLARQPPLRHAWQLVQTWGSARAVTRASRARLVELLGPSRGRGAHDRLRAARPDAVLRAARAAGQRIVTPADAAYPTALFAPLCDPPAALFLQGRDLDRERAVAIVGARRATAFGLDIADVLASELIGVGVCVVSGLALGVDGAAHRSALEAGGETIAVLGCGLDVPYPAAHVTLAERIAGSGTLCSEHPPGQRPERWHFLRRNRLIAALSRAVVVVEAGARSGALVTARLGADLGRDVLAVPGPARSASSAGCHRLLRQGAALCETAADVLHALQWEGETARAKRFEPTGPTAALWRLLDVQTSRNVDALCVQSGLPPEVVSATLTDWELDGHVQRVAGVGFRRRVS